MCRGYFVRHKRRFKRSVVLGDFYVKAYLKNKVDNFECVLVVVYGAAQDEENNIFIQELVQACNVADLPLVVGSDFNIIRSSREK
jgi:hypothetical protein